MDEQSLMQDIGPPANIETPAIVEEQQQLQNPEIMLAQRAQLAATLTQQLSANPIGA
jgi:hypothetical protein